MRKLLILIAIMMVANWSYSQKNAEADSSYIAFRDANRALREFGFKVVDAKPGKWALLEIELMGNLYQTMIKYKGKRGIAVETFGYHKLKKSWTDFTTINNVLGGVEIIVRSEIENEGDLVALKLRDTPFWSQKKSSLKE